MYACSSVHESNYRKIVPLRYFLTVTSITGKFISTLTEINLLLHKHVQITPYFIIVRCISMSVTVLSDADLGHEYTT